LKATFLYLVFGSENFFIESKLSIASILHFASDEDFDYQIIIYTDNPDFYQHSKIITKKIDEYTIKKWSGNINYIYRSKIMCIQDCLQNNQNEIIIFLDTDTIFKKHPKHLINKITPLQSVMHFNESKPNKKLQLTFENENIKQLFNGKFFEPTKNTWNSGIIGIHPNNSRIIDTVILFNDLFYTETKYFATEQIAFSTIFESEISLTSGYNIVFHYWHKIFKDNLYSTGSLQIKEKSLENLSRTFKDYIPSWPLTKKIDFRIRALLYIVLRINRFRVYFSIFASHYSFFS
jgi:hypothetical protein